MKIRNIEGLTPAEIREGVEDGGRFIIYKYCISIVVITFNRPTDIYYIAPGKSDITPGLGWLFLNMIFGWWGIPWGPIHTISNLYTNLTGGKDVTMEIMASINQHDPGYGTESIYNMAGVTSYSQQESSGYAINNMVSSENDSISDVPSQNDTYNIPR